MEESQIASARKAISRADKHRMRGDRSPASTYGQMAIHSALLAVAEANLAVAVELRADRDARDTRDTG